MNRISFFFSAFLVLAFANSADAQSSRFLASAGISLSNSYGGSANQQSMVYVREHLSAGYIYPIDYHHALQGEVSFHTKGWRVDERDEAGNDLGRVIYGANYVSIPLYYRYNVQNTYNVYFIGGVFNAFQTNYFRNSSQDEDQAQLNFDEFDISPYDVGISFGLGLEYPIETTLSKDTWSVALEARYDHSMVSLGSNRSIRQLYFKSYVVRFVLYYKPG